MSAERWKLQASLWQYINDTLTYMATAADFYKKLSEWNDCRKKEHEKIIDIQEKADKIDASFTKSKGRLKKIGKCIKRRFQNNPESKVSELENELAEVLNGTLQGLEKLNTFLDAVEKLAVTSLHVFTENQIVYLPENFDYDAVQAVIRKAQQICPPLLKFKRDAKTFFVPNLHNVEILAFQLQNYINTVEEICLSSDKSFNFEMCLEMAKEIVVDADDMCENNMRKMADQIKQLDKIRMDEVFRVEFLFQSVSSADFVTKFDAKKRTMLSSLDELEQCADQLDRMNKGAKISALAGGSVKKAGGVLSAAGLALTPFTAGVSLGLTFTGATMGLASEANSVVTTLTQAGVNHTHRKKADVVLKAFMEDFQMIQDSLDDGMKYTTVNLKQSKMGVLVTVGKSVSKLDPIVMGVSSVMNVASALIKVVAGKQKKNGNASPSAAPAVPENSAVNNSAVPKNSTVNNSAVNNSAVNNSAVNNSAVNNSAVNNSAVPENSDVPENSTVNNSAVPENSDVPDSSDVLDIGQTVVAESLSLSSELLGITPGAVFAARDIYSAAKQGIKVAKGSKTKASKFLTARVVLFRSQMESWEKIRNSLCQSKLTKEEIRNIFTQPFYLGDKEEQ